MHGTVFVVEGASEGGYIAHGSGESIFTEADDLESLDEQIQDAVDCHFDKGEKPQTIGWVFGRLAEVPGDARNPAAILL